MAQYTLSEVQPWDMVADGYISEIVPIFEKWAMDSIRRVGPRREDVVIDIATGPGTVAFLLAPLVKEVSALDFSPQMIGHLERQIRERNTRNISAMVCDCQGLPYKDNSFDLAFSQFGLMFFPDRNKGFSEMYRVLKPGGKAAVYSWAPIRESSAMTMMMEALFAGFPETKPKDTETRTIVHGLDDLETFRTEMSQVGFCDINFEEIVHSFPLLGPEACWMSMVKGSAPVTLMKHNTPAEEWGRREKVCIQYLRDHWNTTPRTSKAYLAIGKKRD